MLKRVTWLCVSLTLLASPIALPSLAQNSTDSERTRSGQTVSEPENYFDKTFTHHTANVNGVRLHYVMGGSGEPVVLLHGWPTTWQEWKPIMPSLAKRYTVIVPDLRGLGDSEKPLSGYDSRTVAKDIYQLVRSLGFKRIFLVAHDIGGGPAYAYATAYPQNVRRLVMVDAIPAGIQPAASAAGGSEKSYWHLTFHAARDIPEALIAGRERMYINYFFKTYAYNPAAVTEAEIDEYAREYSAPGALRSGFEYYRVMAEDAKVNQELAKTKLRMPVLALGGETVGNDSVLRAMQTVATDVRGGVVPRCGHWVMSEQPVYLTQQLLAFFGEEK